MRSNVDKYFEGYQKVVHSEAGIKKQKTEYIYIGDYYQVDADESERKRIKAKYLLFFLGYLILYFAAALLNTDASKSIAGVISLLILIPIIFQIGGLYNILRSSDLMDNRRIRYGYKRMEYATTVCIFLSLLQIIIDIIVLIYQGSVTDIRLEAAFLVLALAQAALAYLYLRMQRRIEIITIPNKKTPV